MRKSYSEYKVLLCGPRRKLYPVSCSHSKSLFTTLLDSFSTIHVITKVIAFLSRYINWMAECTGPTSESVQKWNVEEGNRKGLLSFHCRRTHQSTCPHKSWNINSVKQAGRWTWALRVSLNIGQWKPGMRTNSHLSYSLQMPTNCFHISMTQNQPPQMYGVRLLGVF